MKSYKRTQNDLSEDRYPKVGTSERRLPEPAQRVRYLDQQRCGPVDGPGVELPLEVLYLRNSDIPQYVRDGVADVAILGENTEIEKRTGNRRCSRSAFPVAGCRWLFPGMSPTRVCPISRGRRSLRRTQHPVRFSETGGHPGRDSRDLRFGRDRSGHRLGARLSSILSARGARCSRTG